MTRLAAFALIPSLISSPVAYGQSAPRPAAAPTAPSAPAVPAAPVAPVPADVATLRGNADDVRQELRELLQAVPPVVGEVLRRDPSLLTRADYLSPYPALAAYVQQHPEVALNASYFIGSEHDAPADAESRGMRMAQDLLEGIGVLVIMSTVFGFFAWLVRVVLDHRRWLRQSRIQVDAHAKILDRLTSHDDLLAYIQSPAGQRFLESAPIEIDGRQRPVNTSLSRVLLAVQAGIVLVALGIGFTVLQGRFGDAGKGFWMLSTLAMALGAGFLLSAGASYVISARHGLIGDVKPSHE